MAVSLKHNFVSAVADAGDASKVQPSNWNEEHVLLLATNKLLGRATAGTGAAEEITLGTGLSFTGTTLNVTVSGAPFDDGTAIVKGSGDATKLLRFEVDGFTTGTTRVLTPPNADGTIAVLGLAQTWTAAQYFNIGTESLPGVAFEIGGNHAYGMYYDGAGGLGFSVNGTGLFKLVSGQAIVGAVTLSNYKEQVNPRTASGSESASQFGGNISTTTTNTGTTSKVTRTLPAWASGLVFRYYVTDTDGIRVQCPASASIRVIDKVTAAAGFIESTTIGSFVEVMALDSSNTWGATRILGTWTDGTFTYDDTSLTTP